MVRDRVVLIFSLQSHDTRYMALGLLNHSTCFITKNYRKGFSKEKELHDKPAIYHH